MKLPLKLISLIVQQRVDVRSSQRETDVRWARYLHTRELQISYLTREAIILRRHCLRLALCNKYIGSEGL